MPNENTASYSSDRPNVATGEGRITPKGKKGKKGKTASKPKGRYDWGDGKGKVHSISLGEHRRNVTAQRNYGLGPNTPLDAPLTADQAWGIAQAQAGQVYDPQIQEVKQAQINTPAWYQNYINTVGASQTAANAYAQPIVQQAQTAVTNAGATAPGLDPSSPQYAKEQQAAQGRQAIVQLGANTLQAIPVATNAYMAGQQAIAARELPQVQAGYVRELGQLRGQRGQAVNEAYGTIRSNEQNAGIARATLGLNTSKAAADIDLARGVDPTTGRPLPSDPEKPITSGAFAGMTPSEVRGLSPAEKKRMRDKYNNRGDGKSQAEKDAKAAEKEKKRIAGIRRASGNFKSKVHDAKTAWERYARVRNPATDAAGNVIPGKFIKATPDQIKQKLREEKYTETEIHVMLMLRAGKPLTRAEIDQIRQQNPDIRIPREWLRGRRRSGPGSTNRAPAPANDPSGYGDRPT